MVVKKYLCAAPRPESWEEKGEALLASLGGDETKREQVVRDTLSALREQHTDQNEKRTGPGRRSNAEHAIAFYEYLLGERDGADDDDGGEDGTDDDTGNEYDDGDDDDGEDDEDGSAAASSDDGGDPGTVESMDTQEFLNQHNDECDVCNLGGVLLCCSTCSLVFHKECVRPVLTKLPKREEEWSCAHCIIQGVRNYKRHSKVWKAAAAGVRQMGRLRSQRQRDSHGLQQEEEQETPQDSRRKKGDGLGTSDADTGEADAENEGSETSERKSETPAQDAQLRSEQQEELSAPLVKTATQKPKTRSAGAAAQDEESAAPVVEQSAPREDDTTGVGEDRGTATSCPSVVEGIGRKRNLALFKLADASGGAAEKQVEALVVRGRRPRRQPALFKPQNCADSRWKSDERTFSEKSKDSDSESGRDDADVTAATAVNKRREGQARKQVGQKEQDGDSDEDDDFPLTRKKTIDGKFGHEGKKSGFVWCNFCRDDPAIPVCVFCACRICFGKHDKEKILLCDKCDEEYHTQCLGLSSVPTTKKWFCPSCDTGRSSKPSTRQRAVSANLASPRIPRSGGDDCKSEGSAASPTPLKRPSPGRKSKSLSTSSNPETPSEMEEKISRGRAPKSTIPPPSSPSQGKRGRPARITTTPEAVDTPKKRGRPPKSASVSPQPAKRGRPLRSESDSRRSVESASPPRKRGRPPKVVISEEVDVKKRVPSRPPSSRAASSTSVASSSSAVSFSQDANEEEIEGPPEPIKVSRISGRTVKRYSFHDEIEEGEQHLRSSKGFDQPEPVFPSTSPPLPSRNKTVLEGEPRKKQKVDIAQEEELQTLNDVTAGVTATESIETIALADSDLKEEKDEDMTEEIAPVRMKTVVKSPAPAMGVPVPMLEPVIPDTGASSPKEEVEHVSTVEIDPPTNVAPLFHVSNANQDVDVADTKPPASSLVPELANEDPKESNVQRVADAPNANVQAPTSSNHPIPATAVPSSSSSKGYPSTPLLDPKRLEAAVKALPDEPEEEKSGPTKVPRRKPGARECMQISRRFGNKVISEKYMTVLLDYCQRGKVEHLIRMRERLDCHSRYLESQLAGLEALVLKHGESDLVVPAIPERADHAKKTSGAGVLVAPPVEESVAKARGGGAAVVVVGAKTGSGGGVPTEAVAPSPSGANAVRTAAQGKRRLDAKAVAPSAPAVRPQVPRPNLVTGTKTKTVAASAPAARPQVPGPIMSTGTKTVAASAPAVRPQVPGPNIATGTKTKTVAASDPAVRPQVPGPIIATGTNTKTVAASAPADRSQVPGPNMATDTETETVAASAPVARPQVPGPSMATVTKTKTVAASAPATSPQVPGPKMVTDTKMVAAAAPAGRSQVPGPQVPKDAKTVPAATAPSAKPPGARPAHGDDVDAGSI